MGSGPSSPPRSRMTSPTPFDAAYFRRYYFNRRTKVVTRGEMRARAELIAAVLRDAQHPIRSILDAGCGIGMFKPAFARVLKRARYVGLDASEYLCRRYGWVQGSVADFKPARPFDLVVCYDVLQYLDDRAAARAMANLGRLSRVALYFSALTIEDWRRNCDRSRTDRAVRMRPAAWYRARLRRNFYFLGLGVWIRKTVPTVRWALESC
jgi:SAM-dependent methyltransferase